MLKKIKNFKWGYALFAILFVALGVAFIAFRNSLSYLAISLGVILLTFGVVYAALTLAKPERSFSFFIRIIFAIVAIICAIITLINNEGTVDIIGSIIALLLIIDATFKLQTATLSKRYNLFGWWLMLGVAVAVIILSYIILKFDANIAASLPIWLAITLIIDGAGNLFSAFFVPRYEKCMKEGIYYSMLNEQNADPDDTPIFDAQDFPEFQSEDSSENA